MPFDRDSGLVFRETTIAMSKQQQPLPIYTTDTPRPEKRASRTQLGTRSLLDSSMLAMLRNLDSLNSDSLRNVPEPLLKQIYQSIERK
jgi:hypothetical protein